MRETLWKVQVQLSGKTEMAASLAECPVYLQQREEKRGRFQEEGAWEAAWRKAGVC